MKKSILPLLFVGIFFVLLGASCSPTNPSPVPVDENDGSDSTVTTTCETDNDCDYTNKFRCQNNVCVNILPFPNTQACGSGEDTWGCRSDQWCSIESNVCLDEPICHIDSDCGDNMHCSNGYCLLNNNINTNSNGNSENTTMLHNDGMSCTQDTICHDEFLCYQGMCTEIPERCDSNPECLTNDSICENNICVYPNLEQKVCQNANADRWFCDKDQWCGKNEGCSDIEPGGEACSYYINGIQENWRCNVGQWCGIEKDACFDEPFCKSNIDCENNENCVNGYCLLNNDSNSDKDTISDTTTTCETDNDCDYTNKFRCQNNVCVNILPFPNTQACGSGEDTWGCRSDQWCSIESNVCLDEPICHINPDCDDDERCSNGYCIKDSVITNDNYNSHTNTYKTLCKDDKGYNWECDRYYKCGLKFNECTEQTQIGNNCTYYNEKGYQDKWVCDSDQWCGIIKGECFDEPFCKSNIDCKGEKICNNGYCVRDNT